MKNRIIPLVLVPIFALAACSQSTEPEQIAVPNDSDKVILNSDGSMSQNALLDSYNQAKAQGYTGTLDQWSELSRLYETNPQQAQQVAQESGFSGGEMLMGALAGAAIGALAANAMSSRTQMASNSYSSQRANNATNYAYSQPYNREEEKDRRNTASAAPIVTGSNSPTGSTGTSATRPSSPVPSVSTPRPAAVSAPVSRSSSFTSVSRGGFGGAVSSGG